MTGTFTNKTTKGLTFSQEIKSNPFYQDMSFLTNFIALCIFVLSFVSPWFSHSMRNIGLFALSGALTNWIAVHMLFEKVPGLYGSGIIPLRFKEFKNGIRSLIMDEFFTLANIERFMKSKNLKDIIDDIKKLGKEIDYEKIYDKLLNSLLESPLGGMLSMVGGASALEPAKPKFVEQLRKSFLDIFEEKKVRNFLQEKIQGMTEPEQVLSKIDEIVYLRLEELTPEMVKVIIQNMIKKHLGWLVLWGGVFGGLIGLLASFV